VAQEAINDMLGPQRVVQLHAMLDDCLARLGPGGPTDEND
jgi:hypothetical protein